MHRIAEYISNDSKRYAKLQVKRLKNRILILKTQNRIRKIVPEINKAKIRAINKTDKLSELTPHVAQPNINLTKFIPND